MGKSILITGGARSGKSIFAEAKVRDLGPATIYVATAQPRDAEMRDRIARHQARRGDGWTTTEAPLDLVGALNDTDNAPRLVDCLTLWLTNLMLAEVNWMDEVEALLHAIKAQSHPVVFVTNEVGMGIVPQTPLGRDFRDAAGMLNQQVAAVAEEVYLVVSGLPLKVKPNAEYPPDQRA